MINISNLSLDILIHIFSFVPPRDVILGARQVCLHWNHASTNISLWKTLLRHVCFKNILLPFACPCEMALKDFEHAATSPARFLSILHSSSEHDFPLKVYSKDYIDTDLLRDIPVFSESVSAIYLIPGGRYMITQHEGFTSEIHFWDLGVPGNSKKNSSDLMPLDSLEDRSFLAPLPAYPTRDGKEVIIFACKDNSLEQEGKCKRDIFVYEIYPTLEDSSFRQISTHSFMYSVYDGYNLSYAFDHENLVMFVDNDTVRVWNFVAGSEATWSASGFSINSHVFLQDKTVIIHYHNLVSIFTVPEQHPSGSTLARDVRRLNPFCSSELPHVAHLVPQFDAEAPDSWYSQSKLPIHVDSLVYSEDGNLHDENPPAIRYRLDVSLAIDEHLSKVSGSQLSSKTSDFITLPASDGCAEEYRVCENRMISYWSFNRGLAIRSAPLGAIHDPRTLEPSRIVTAVHKSPANEQNLVSLCPASGRAVHCHAERLLIEIVDFLPHPTAKSEPLPDYETDSD